MTLDQLIQRAKDALNAKIAARNALTEELNKLRSVEGFDVTREAEMIAQRGGIDAEKEQLEARLAMLEAEKVAEDAVQRLQATITPIGQRAGDGAERTTTNATTREPRTYTRESAAQGVSFFSDAFRMTFKQDMKARDRIERHAREVEVHGELSERAVTTASFAGLVIPQYLPEMYALALRAGRPLANICNRHQIPAEGMNIVLQRGTTGAATAIQATENSGAQNTDEVWTDLTIPVRTIAGQQAVSRQSLERGSMVDAIVYEDLTRAYAANLDNQLINGTGASGQILGILNTGSIGAATAFGAAPTAANFSLKVAGGITNVTSAGAGIMARAIVMHPRRWGWLTGIVDSSNRPVVTANTIANFNAIGVISNPGAGSADLGSSYFESDFVGVHNSGLPVLTDLNVPINVGTNVEDIVLVLDTREMHLWEDGDGMPRQLSFEQTAGNNLTTALVVYGYAAFTAGRYPGAVSKIGGLDSTATYGLVAPSF